MLMLEGSTTAKTAAQAQRQSEVAEPDKEEGERLVSIKEMDSITRSSMSKTQQKSLTKSSRSAEKDKERKSNELSNKDKSLKNSKSLSRSRSLRLLESGDLEGEQEIEKPLERQEYKDVEQPVLEEEVEATGDQELDDAYNNQLYQKEFLEDCFLFDTAEQADPRYFTGQSRSKVR